MCYDKFMNNATLISFGNSAVMAYIRALDVLEYHRDWDTKQGQKALDKARCELHKFYEAGMINELDAVSKTYDLYLAHNAVLASYRRSFAR